ncbi:hypothetical protein EC609_19450 [Achromobacter denitrificans]|nr:hypothetical protein EC609_19450 [Achromobacter denitrificans]
MSLNVPAYNLKRVMRILGFQQTIKAMLPMGAPFMSNDALHIVSAPLKRPLGSLAPKDRSEDWSYQGSVDKSSI